MISGEMKDVFSTIDNELDLTIKDIMELVSIPSISSQGKGIEETATQVEKLFAAAGFETRRLAVPGANPAIFARLKGEGKGRVLFYNHYDVQPAGPREEWSHDPFSPRREGDILSGRGMMDNKGDLVARIAAVRAFRETRGKLPLDVLFLVEGEEEISSMHLEEVVKENQELLQADVCIWETGGKTFSERPIIYLGAKGICYLELEAEGASRDLHSSVATSIPNPAWRLAWALNSLKGPDEKILVPGFYERILPPGKEEREALSLLPDEDKETLQDLALSGFVLGQGGRERWERDMFSPTCNICGINSGYTGPGMKTVLPHRATAKLDFRLVANQDPDEVLAQVNEHLGKQGLGEIRVRMVGKEKPFRTPLKDPFARTVVAVAREVHQSEPVVYPTFRGTGPMYLICGKLGMPGISLGIGNARSRMHGPDENVRVTDLQKGMHLVAALLAEFPRSRGQ